ncbi:type VII secretion protein EccB [Streptomyces sp. NPDC021749]|uniref:type VII secretion protein EccB n=1 Tax=Streptomyces sp. NPDC021749 TaxID=3154905 RepID=UPI0033ED2103
MASRRDELNAYSFARKRTNAAFLKPLPNGSIESAPKPLKAVVPSAIMGVLMLVGFGACGILKPVAPSGWDKPQANLIVGSESSTRYVVLPNTDLNGHKRNLLHPVLNLASAKLLLDPDKYSVVKVQESELDGKITHGPAVGIPYAPDRLPTPQDVDKPKVWAVCNRPGSGQKSKPQQAVFVLSGKDKQLVDDPRTGRLDVHEALYVEDPDGKRWLVDNNGTAFQFDSTMGGRVGPIGGASKTNRDLERIIFGDSVEPQKVTPEFMDTLIKSPVPIGMPTVPDAGKQTPVKDVPDKYRTVGTVLQTDDSPQKYVVQADGVYKVSNFIAKLLLQGQNAQAVNKDGSALTPQTVSTTSFNPKTDDSGHVMSFMGTIPTTDVPMPWPTEEVSAANNYKQDPQTGGLNSPTGNGVACSVYKGTNTKYPGQANKLLGFPNGVPNMQTWVGKDYPAKIAPGASAYVTPGSGLLYRQASTPSAKFGSLFLVTDTGLRYSVPENNDGGNKAGKADQEQGQSQLHLGYKSAHPPLILKTWSDLLSAGPMLDVQSAKKPQAS